MTFALDESARHAACPLIAGEKFIANVWIHPTAVNESMSRCAKLEGKPKKHAACMRKQS